MEMVKGLGEDEVRLWGRAHHIKGDLRAQQLGLELLEDREQPWGSSMA